MDPNTSHHSEQYNQAPPPITILLIAASENVLSYETGLCLRFLFCFNEQNPGRFQMHFQTHTKKVFKRANLALIRNILNEQSRHCST